MSRLAFYFYSFLAIASVVFMDSNAATVYKVNYNQQFSLGNGRNFLL